MSQKMTSIFKKRFGDRINVVYADKPLRASEGRMQNSKICKAVTSVISGILGREPTQNELLGIDDISVHKRRKRK